MEEIIIFFPVQKFCYIILLKVEYSFRKGAKKTKVCPYRATT